jgi:ubiquinone/menaquinone biosynthesis C-methylase UbiE
MFMKFSQDCHVSHLILLQTKQKVRGSNSMATQQAVFDATKYKLGQRDQWNKDSAAWHRWNPIIESWIGDATVEMLDMADIYPGYRILDIAAGTGEPAVSAAALVGPEGYILATDIAEDIIRLAGQVAKERGVEQIETRVMDGEDLELADASFDTVLCRLGLMYMPNPAVALNEWYRVLKPGGRVAIVVFSTADRNGWGLTPVSIIRERAKLPPPIPGQPGPFSLGAAGVLEDMLLQAGFVNPCIRTIPAPLKMSSTAKYIDMAQQAFGAFNAMMAQMASEERESVWAEVEESMREFDTADGFEAPGECIVASATK